MNPRSLRTLEFLKVLARLAEHTSFSAGRELVLNLVPATDFDEVTRRQQETTEAKDLIARRGSVTLGGVHDVRPQVERASISAVLQPQDLLDIRDTMSNAGRLRRLIYRGEQPYPLLRQIATRLADCSELVAEIERCIDDNGQVMDGASPTLGRIRRELKIARERLAVRLERIIASARNRPFLQEVLVTQREGRYVIPIKTDFKGRIPGLVHDVSASGATLFIEPLATVELGNHCRQLESEEEKEIERILRALSAHVAEEAPTIKGTVEALADLDLALAKARYSFTIRGVEPQLIPGTESRRGRSLEPVASTGSARSLSQSKGRASLARSIGEAVSGQSRDVLSSAGSMRLIQARHPLLPPETVVPIDIHLGGDDDFFILIITGPNTGGKTVTLKTVGLLALMAQSGLHIPAGDGSALSVFSGVYADIGDEQSIEQSLSTFSSHLTNIIEILQQADERCLVLLDELGAGTDPVEGSALARAILSHLLERHIITLVATHFSELKVYAQTTPGVANASVEFDVKTLAPTYKLTIGLPGRSNAFAIARRLGLWPAIIEQAQASLSSSELTVETLLAEIKEAHREAQEDQAEAERSRQVAAEAERALTQRLIELERERREIINQAREEAYQELEAVRREVQHVRARLQRLATASPDGRAELDDIAAVLEELESETEPLGPAPVPVSAELEALTEGDRVWVRSLSREGQVASLLGEDVEVQVGNFRARVPVVDLERREKREQPISDGREVTVTTVGAPAPGLELSLRGLTVDEALPRLEKYLDDAYLAGYPKVRIVHGKGTGTLRRMVRQELKGHPLVASFRPGDRYEGGDGVTVAELAQN